VLGQTGKPQARARSGRTLTWPHRGHAGRDTSLSGGLPWSARSAGSRGTPDSQAACGKREPGAAEPFPAGLRSDGSSALPGGPAAVPGSCADGAEPSPCPDPAGSRYPAASAQRCVRPAACLGCGTSGASAPRRTAGGARAARCRRQHALPARKLRSRTLPCVKLPVKRLDSLRWGRRSQERLSCPLT